MQLYRGFSEPVDKTVLENKYLVMPRKPRNSAPFVHEVADNWFYKKFDIKARSQTIFCSPDIEQAKGYGHPYKVAIPDDVDYKLIFSTNVKDFLCIELALHKSNCEEEIINWLEKQSYVAVNSVLELPEDFDGEVMLYCERYEVSKV